MKRIGLAAVLALALPTAAAAMMPPSYKVMVVGPDEETEGTSWALIEMMSRQNAFFRVESDLSRNEAAGCLTAPDLAACVHARVSARPVDPRARPVVIIVRPVSTGVVAWTCLGSGSNAKAPPAAEVEFDLEAALFGDPASRTEARRKAMRCIYAAEAESFGG